MSSHHSLSDEVFESMFAAGDFPPAWFTHEAHLRLGWIYINKYGIDDAVRLFNCRLLNFVTVVGARDKYNQTVTTAALYAIHHFMRRSDEKTFDRLIETFPRLLTDFKGLMRCHYHTDIFVSPLAKTQYLEPELLSFD